MAATTAEPEEEEVQMKIILDADLLQIEYGITRAALSTVGHAKSKFLAGVVPLMIKVCR